MNPYVEALRLERWPRSTAIFLGSAAFILLEAEKSWVARPAWLISRALLAFLLTWGISTANYVVNEIADAPYDRHHPTKRLRPLVSGRIKKTPFLVFGLILTFACFILALVFFNQPFVLSLFALLVAGFLYNVPPLRTKDIPFLDAISESANNPLRFLIGWYGLSSSHPPFPPLSLLISWWAFGNFLMVAKRLSEYRWLRDKASNYRQSLGKYSLSSLLAGMVASAVVFFGGYIWFCLTQGLPHFLYYIPFLLMYFMLFFWKTLTEKGVMEEPERLFRRPLFALFTLGLLLLFLISFPR